MLAVYTPRMEDTSNHPRPLPEAAYICPKCRYSLRGLAGDPVRCPECGQEHPRAQLAALFGTPKTRFETLRAALDEQTGWLLTWLFMGAPLGFGLASFLMFGRGKPGGSPPGLTAALAAAALLAGLGPLAIFYRPLREVRLLVAQPDWWRPVLAYQGATVALLVVPLSAWLAFSILLSWLGGQPIVVGLVGGLVVTVLVTVWWRPVRRLRAVQERSLAQLTDAVCAPGRAANERSAGLPGRDEAASLPRE